MKTVLFCGGKGERLREYESSRPKPLWTIAGKPLIWHVMNIYAMQGFSDFVLCTGYKHDEFVSYFVHNPETAWTIIFDNKGEDCPTGGRLESALKFIDTDMFFCNYADGLSNIPLPKLLEAHHTSGKMATLTAVKPVLPYGILEIDDHNLVTQFREKPVIDHWVNGGFFVFSNQIRKYLSATDMLEEGPFSRLAADGQLNAFRHEGEWMCMDTYKDYMNLIRLMESTKPSWLKRDSFIR